MKYPKINKKPLTQVQKKSFDDNRKKIEDLIIITSESISEKLTKKTIEILAWNIAFIFI